MASLTEPRQFRHLDGYAGRYDSAGEHRRWRVVWVPAGSTCWEARHNEVAGPHDELDDAEAIAADYNQDIERCRALGLSEDRAGGRPRHDSDRAAAVPAALIVH